MPSRTARGDGEWGGLTAVFSLLFPWRVCQPSRKSWPSPRAAASRATAKPDMTSCTPRPSDLKTVISACSRRPGGMLPEQHLTQLRPNVVGADQALGQRPQQVTRLGAGRLPAVDEEGRLRHGLGGQFAVVDEGRSDRVDMHSG